MATYKIEAKAKEVDKLVSLLESKEARQDYITFATEQLKTLDEEILELEQKLNNKRKEVEVLEKSVEQPKTKCNCESKPSFMSRIRKVSGMITLDE